MGVALGGVHPAAASWNVADSVSAVADSTEIDVARMMPPRCESRYPIDSLGSKIALNRCKLSGVVSQAIYAQITVEYAIA